MVPSHTAGPAKLPGRGGFDIAPILPAPPRGVSGGAAGGAVGPGRLARGCEDPLRRGAGHGQGRPHIRHGPAPRRGQDGGGDRLVVRELADDQPVVLAEGDIVGEYFAPGRLEEPAGRLGAVLGVGGHALDRVEAVAALGDEDRHGSSPPQSDRPIRPIGTGTEYPAVAAATTTDSAYQGGDLP